ncbi:hypothetical protein [Sphingobacterium tabacisoli]|uniref:Lipoprotein n=1 Tax=Sphingobacterium tabacisoli TaxID=2044855 RepID=A0ABW5L5W2_9SPHI|nr:hypothetical protein [Sphingobacterium tabacisoli]
MNRSRTPTIGNRALLLRGLVCLSLGILLYSCSSLKQSAQTGMVQIGDVQTFDGIYKNASEGNSGIELRSLWNQLALHDDLDTVDFERATIELHTLGKKEIKATRIQDGVEMKSLVLHGKLKDNYFVSKPKRSVVPIPFIYGQVKNNQFQIWLDKEGRLHVDRLYNRWGWVFVFLAGTDNTSSYVYDRLKD